MDISSLEIFSEVAHRLSFSEVARARQIEPSSVSRAIAIMEGDLGVRLFHRTTRKLALTEAGLLYLGRIEPLIALLADARETVQSIGRSPVGTIRVSTSVAFGHTRIVPLLGAFHDSYPRLKLELLMSDANIDLVRDGVDLAIRLAPGVESNVVVSKLLDTRYHVVASPAWLSTHSLASPEDLRTHNVLRLTLPGYRDRWLFRKPEGETFSVAVDGSLLVSSALGLRDAAVANLGPALLADWLIAEDLRAGRLLDCFPNLRVTATEFETAAWLIYPSRDLLANKVRVTIDFLRRHFGQHRYAP